MQNKLICISNSRVEGITKVEIKRLPVEEARDYLHNGWHTTSKGRYKRYLKELEPKHPSGAFRRGMPKTPKYRKSNNRATTRGRLILHTNVAIRKVFKKLLDKVKVIKEPLVDRASKDKGFTRHEAITYTRVDPITGVELKVKSGKGRPVEDVITMRKGEILRTKRKTRLVNVTDLKARSEEDIKNKDK